MFESGEEDFKYENQHGQECRKLKLSQAEYVEKVLQIFNMKEAKSLSTQLASYFRLSKDQQPKAEQEKEHMRRTSAASAVGSLMHDMICTKTDIAHAVTVISMYVSNLRKHYWETVK